MRSEAVIYLQGSREQCCFRGSGIDWKRYQRPLSEHVYDVYIQYWADVRLACDDPHAD